jgi:hypothetical protein
MTVKHVDPLTIRPDAFCLPPETACEILNVLNEINEEFKAELNKNNCKAKDTLAGFAQVFMVITNQALNHIGDFFDFDKDDRINDRVINHPSQDSLILNLKKLKIDPFVCEKIAYYQEKIASIRNQVLFNEHGEASDIWRSFSEEILGELINNLFDNPFFEHNNNFFRLAIHLGDIQVIQTLRTNQNCIYFSRLSFIGSLDNEVKEGNTKMVQALIKFSNFNHFIFQRALSAASHYGNLEIVQMLIDSGHFQDMSADDLGKALQIASEKNHLEIIQAIISTDHFIQLLKTFPEV